MMDDTLVHAVCEKSHDAPLCRAAACTSCALELSNQATPTGRLPSSCLTREDHARSRRHDHYKATHHHLGRVPFTHVSSGFASIVVFYATTTTKLLFFLPSLPFVCSNANTVAKDSVHLIILVKDFNTNQTLYFF